MDISDFLFTPIYLVLFYVLAYAIRPSVTTKDNRKFFIPALTFKFVGCIGFALIYQFYYKGGDTFNYYYHSSVVFSSLKDDPALFWKMLTSSGQFDPELYPYTSRMFWYESASEYLVVKYAAFFALLCFNTYTVVSLFFALISFSGLWALYTALYDINPHLKKEFAIAVFFIPSVFFWGSGLMKDTLCLGAVGWIFWGIYRLFIIRKGVIMPIIMIMAALAAVQTMKIYILLCLLPALLFWLFLEVNSRMKNKGLRMLFKPIFLIFGVGAAYFASITLTEDDAKYNIEAIGETAQKTSVYLYNLSVHEQGSAYNIGELDGTLGGMVSLAPQAIVVTLFRPFIWEIRNPVMFLSALESAWFVFLTFTIIFKGGFLKSIRTIGKTPLLVFCFIFALVFAFAVGSTSFNFGTLVRYKIPLIPFYVSGLFILKYLQNPVFAARLRRASAVLAK